MAPIRQPTSFEQRVYDALRKIPRGRVTTYLALARYLGCGSPRAVGQALRRNPFAPEAPCHRVVRGDLSLGGFHGSTQGAWLEHKKELLVAEGVRFGPGGKVSPDCCIFEWE